MAHLQTLQTALLGLSISLASSGCVGPDANYHDQPSDQIVSKTLTMETYTPTPVQMTDVSLPQDAIDQLVVSTVRTALEPMADGIAYLNQQEIATRAATLLASARFYLPAATYADNDFVAFTVQDRTASADGYAEIVAVSATGGGNAITVNVGNASPRDVGWWRVSVDISEVDFGADIVTALELYQFDAAASADPLSGSIVARWDSTKRTGAGNSGSVQGEYLFKQGTGTTRIGLAFRVQTGGTWVVSGTSPTLRARINIQQTNRAPLTP